MRAKTQKRENEIEKEYTTKIKYFCKKRGWVEEEVKVTRYITKEIDETTGYSFLDDEDKDIDPTEGISILED
jgi:succinate dehydrogenase flavin-adding protein (antitoxin of CptAB toxin-antitoxin module)